jgi:hypothetical protein
MQWIELLEQEPALELLLQVQPDEALEWHALFGNDYSGWHDLESAGQIIQLIKSLTGDGDWLTIQTKGLDALPAGRYAQAMNLGCGYQVEVAQTYGAITYSWRIGLGPTADSAKNRPNTKAEEIQILQLAEVIEVLSSWLRGHGLPLGYGAALHIYE